MQPRSDSSAPQPARLMMAGRAGAAAASTAASRTAASLALPAPVLAPTVARASTVASPGSTRTALSPVTLPLPASAQTWRPSAPAVTTASVPSRAPASASGVPRSGAMSDADTPTHSDQLPASRTR